MFRVGTLALVGGLCVASLNLTACQPFHSAEDPRTTTQLVEITVVQRAGAGERAFTGVVSARVQSNLGFRVSGKVIERLVDSGQVVHKGQPLMRLDRTDYAYAITTQLGNVDAARARLLQAAADEARYRGLVSSGAVSKSAYDQVKAVADSAQALLLATEAQLRVAQDEGNYATLAADADGTVVETLAEPGQFALADDPRHGFFLGLKVPVFVFCLGVISCHARPQPSNSLCARSNVLWNCHFIAPRENCGGRPTPKLAHVDHQPIGVMLQSAIRKDLERLLEVLISHPFRAGEPSKSQKLFSFMVADRIQWVA
jgi:multidrug efflux pump subunit AcrA (membrane-fusion protein)